MQGWGVMAAVEPVLYEWASVQLGLLGSWLGRLLPAETWAPITQPQGCSRSGGVQCLSCAPASLWEIWVLLWLQQLQQFLQSGSIYLQLNTRGLGGDRLT